VLLENLATTVTRTQPAAIEIGKHFLSRRAKGDALDRSDFLKPGRA
jgi:hypothetical protein